MSGRNVLADVLFPENLVCPFCNREALTGDDGICANCRAALVRCPPFLRAPDGLDGLTAGLIYNEAVEDAVHRFKYRRQAYLAPFLAGFITLPPGWRIDCIVPVPLHPLRQWLRTFNQSELLSEALTNRYPLPIRTDLLRRIRYTTPQAGLSASRRKTNLVGAFCAKPRVNGLSCLLVDDVTTTHSTLRACAAALRQAGATRVYAACACIAVQEGRSPQTAKA